MRLKTMEPNPAWDPDAYPEVLDVFGGLDDDAVVRVWGGDWCGDCRSQLPDFAAALDAAGVDHVEVYAVERENGEKVGEYIDEYDVDVIPTIVVERDGVELARFEEREQLPPELYLTEELGD